MGRKSRFLDISGEKRGRLTAMHVLKGDAGTQSVTRSVSWLFRCDCGGFRITTQNIFHLNQVKSCGCTRHSSKWRLFFVTCPACGEKYTAKSIDEPIPQFCPDCTPKYAGRNWKVCAICKKLFPDPPSNNRVTCSKECSAKWRAITHKGVSNKWCAEAKQRWSDRGQTENLKKGTDAIKCSPVTGRFETNQNAKIWTLVDPCGKEIVVRNLLNWSRENAELFGKPPGDKSAIQISSGFKAIRKTLDGKPGGAYTYFGWTLKCLPEDPPD